MTHIPEWLAIANDRAAIASSDKIIFIPEFEYIIKDLYFIRLKIFISISLSVVL
jgi:hypothetical protein